MSTPDLSILIPARNEMFLARTMQDILAHIEGNTEIIVVLDGYLPDPPLPTDPRCTVIYHPESIGQRAATNEAARLASGKYVMKIDAHCAFDQGFDVKMIAKMEDDITMVPVMRNLHVFNWVCNTCGMEIYQGPDPKSCRNETCNFDKNGTNAKSNFRMEVVWIPKTNPQSSAYRFNKDLRFKYFPELRAKQAKEGLVETMSLQGSCFVCTREKYWSLGLCDDSWGSWGQQGTEVALKTWLSGGRVLCNRDTWYAHLFRTQDGFGHPYPGAGESQQHAIQVSKEIFMNDKWAKAIHPLSWLLDKFWFALKEVGDQDARWAEEDLAKLKANTFTFPKSEPSRSTEIEPPQEGPTKGIIYYTDNQLDPNIARAVQNQLKKIGLPIVCASLQKMDFGTKNIHFHSLQRGILTMFKQILGALENSSADIIFFAEHDVLYHPSHFDFTPPKKDVYYYNVNVWKVRLADGHALKVNDSKQLSGLCGYRRFLIEHYKKRIDIINKRQQDLKSAGKPIKNDGVSKYMGYEPGMHSPPRGVDNFPVASWQSEYPNIDIRHENNWTPSRWSKAEFVDKKYTLGWTESTADKIPGWPSLLDRFSESKGIIYYTDSELDEKIAKPVRDQLNNIGLPIVSASLKKMAFGVKNIHFPSLKKGYPAMFKQIVAALEHSTADIIFFSEHDVLYHPSHFDFTPPDKNTFYYNQNVWFLRTKDGQLLKGWKKSNIDHIPGWKNLRKLI
ncbi:MAG: Uncharacterized protein G01um101416_702 [Microgenomates group bacterium Gr01-1014_16]|nr:MAG: Uncharacterized protein G01um101416_702 [Microgenomates group bacterium Gr01-1014_16]